jgi:hypothetical protein
MKIIIKQNLSLSDFPYEPYEKILKIIYSDSVSDYIYKYMNQDIESLKMVPLNKNIKSEEYNITFCNNVYTLVKNTYKSLKGYMYNTIDNNQTELYLIKVMDYNELYSNIVKKPAVFNFPNVPCKTLEIKDGKLIGNSRGLPDISKWNNKIEYTIIN